MRPASRRDDHSQRQRSAQLAMLARRVNDLPAQQPVVVAGDSAGGGLALALAIVVAQVTPVYFLVANMVLMMGLAVGIDYSLFMLVRYREERRAGASVPRAVERSGAPPSTDRSKAVATAGRGTKRGMENCARPAPVRSP